MYRNYIALLWWALWVCPVSAQPLGREQVEDLALARQRQPKIQAAQLEVEATHKLIQQAHAAPNPVLGLSTEVPAIQTMSRFQLSVSQTVELGGKKDARVQAAQVSHEEAGARQRHAEQQVLFEVRQAYTELLAAERKWTLDQEALNTARRQWHLAHERFKLGDVPHIEVLQLQVETSRAEAAALQSESEVMARRGALANWLQTPAAQLQISGRLGSDLDLPELEPMVVAALEQRPDLDTLQLSERRKDAEVRLEEARAVSDLNFQLGLAYDRTYISPVNQNQGLTGIGLPVISLAAGVSIPLPWNDDNRGNIEAARLRAQAAGEERQALLRQARTEVETAYYLALAQQRARRALAKTLPLTLQTMSVLEQAYRVRARSLTEVLQARRAYLEAARAELEAARQEELSLVRLEAATARRLPR